MEKRNGFNVGDKVVIDFDNPRNEDLAIRYRKDINDLVFTVVRVGSYDLDVDKPVMSTQRHGRGWMLYRFKLAKNHIIKAIIDDLL